MSRKVYNQEFRDSAIKMVVDQNQEVASSARRLGIDPSTLRDWVRKFRSASPHTTISANLAPAERIRQLEAENARLRMEREILKKAAAFFAKEHQP